MSESTFGLFSHNFSPERVLGCAELLNSELPKAFWDEIGLSPLYHYNTATDTDGVTELKFEIDVPVDYRTDDYLKPVSYTHLTLPTICSV